MINLIQGSIFSAKCDVLIIPCNNNCGVTNSMKRDLVSFNIPLPVFYMQPGEIRFVGGGANYSISSVIGYAASVNVDSGKSKLEYLDSIFKSIVSYCTQHSHQVVNIPLLGTGAGGLKPDASYSRLVAAFSAETQITVNVYVPSQTVYFDLYCTQPHNLNVSLHNPRVFISYTGNNDKNRLWVKQLATKLRECGVNARLDLFHLKPGQDLPQWMTNEVILAEKVLLICDSQYADKADNHKGGVGWETMIIQGDMLSSQNAEKYVAILRDANIDRSLPVYVRSKFALDWSEFQDKIPEDDFNQLLSYLFDCNIEPPIGKIPDFIVDSFK